MGKSGNLQPFDLIARRRVEGKDYVVVLDLVFSSQPLDVVPVSALMGKIIDAGANVGILVAIPGITQAGRSLADLYDILVIEAENAQDASTRFESRLRNVIEGVK
jgi:hypothetical protein